MRPGAPLGAASPAASAALAASAAWAGATLSGKGILNYSSPFHQLSSVAPISRLAISFFLQLKKKTMVTVSKCWSVLAVVVALWLV